MMPVFSAAMQRPPSPDQQDLVDRHVGMKLRMSVQ
jgi:hypothetical protein